VGDAAIHNRYSSAGGHAYCRISAKVARVCQTSLKPSVTSISARAQRATGLQTTFPQLSSHASNFSNSQGLELLRRYRKHRYLLQRQARRVQHLMIQASVFRFKDKTARGVFSFFSPIRAIQLQWLGGLLYVSSGPAGPPSNPNPSIGPPSTARWLTGGH